MHGIEMVCYLFLSLRVEIDSDVTSVFILKVLKISLLTAEIHKTEIGVDSWVC